MTAEEYKARRVAICHTQTSLATELEVSRDTIIRREAGSAVINREAALAILALPCLKQAVDPKEAGEKFVAHLAANPPIKAEDGKVIAQVRSIKAPQQKVDLTTKIVGPTYVKPTGLGELALARQGRQPILRPGSKQ